jgi:4-hydroxy-tetrahydrodipicolinate reductase
MNIALLGYGKMGHEIEAIAKSKGHHIPLIIDINNQTDLNKENLEKVDVAIEFSTPQTAYNNILKCFEAHIPIVVGTTGWLDKFEEISNIVLSQKQGLFYASNYSIGVNIFFKINLELARLMNSQPDYDVNIVETHHITKLDAPSGTAISLANDIIKVIDRKKHWKLDQHEPETLNIHAVRRENVPGIHNVKYESEVDFIEIIHNAKSRKGFALGAVLAAEYMRCRKGIYGMNDLLNF